MTNTTSRGESAAAPHRPLTVIALYVDQFGFEHTTRMMSTRSAEQFEAELPRFRAATERFYAELGYHLCSLQLECCEAEVVFERPAAVVPQGKARAGHLRLATMNGASVACAECGEPECTELAAAA